MLGTSHIIFVSKSHYEELAPRWQPIMVVPGEEVFFSYLISLSVQ